jgi:hypothetical protein
MFAPALVLGATDEMDVMKDEIFGPILPILPYRQLEDAVAYINARPRPLALYFFGPEGPGRELVRPPRRPAASPSTTPFCIRRRRTFPLAASVKAAWAPITPMKTSRP